MIRARRPRHGLFWRVYSHGLVLIVAVAAALLTVGWLVQGEPGWLDARQRAASYVAGRLAPILESPPELQREVDLAREALGIDLTLFGAQGQVLASAGEPVSPEPTPPRAPELTRSPHTWRLAVPVASAGAYLVAATARPRVPRHLIVVAVVVLLVAAGFSVPLVRAIIKPLERLTDAAERFGNGELGVRSGIRRSDEVGALAQAFDEMTARIEALLKSEKELLANVSHELRTPLARIRLALELARESAEPRQVLERLAGIGSDLMELESLIENTLIVARLDLGPAGERALPLRKERVRPVVMVEAAVARLREAHPKRAALVEVPAELPLIDVDPALVRRVLDNLLDNAVKYTPPESGPITLCGRDVDGMVELEVRDRGPGVPADALPRLFDPFFRVDASRSRDLGGVGLGLTLCRRIVAAHGGSIVARLNEPHGLVVSVRLPHGTPAVSPAAA